MCFHRDSRFFIMIMFNLEKICVVLIAGLASLVKIRRRDICLFQTYCN